MITLETLPEASSAKLEWRELFDLQLSVARRADALARRASRAGRDGDRQAWLRAEFEVFERVEQAER
jgi:hypothetical protein